MTEADQPIAAIAAEVGTTERTVSRWRAKMRLAKPAGRPLTPDERRWVLAAVADGVPLNWIAETLDRNVGTIGRVTSANPESLAAWKSIWGEIRYNDSLVELHREFAP